MKINRRQFFQLSVPTAIVFFVGCQNGRSLQSAMTKTKTTVANTTFNTGAVFDGFGFHFAGEMYFSGTKKPPIVPTSTPTATNTPTATPTITPTPTNTPTPTPTPHRQFMPIIFGGNEK